MTTIEAILKRDRAIIIGGLVVVIVIFWAYILAGAGMEMDAVADDAMVPKHSIWTPAHIAPMLVMWWVMMAAMMLPSAAPTVLLFAAVNRKNRQQAITVVPTSVFASGYLVAWGGFSVAAVALQWALEQSALLSPMMETASIFLGGTLLIAAGAYQLSPLKHACLRHCRSPAEFLARHWRSGAVGAFRIGFAHGVFCLGCCWVLMALLFYGGVMDLWWIAGLAGYVLVEKLAPAGHNLSRFTGGILILWGLWLIVELPKGI